MGRYGNLLEIFCFGEGKEEEREAVIQPVTNLILMNEMDLKALMLLCLQFHFVIVTDDVAAVRLSAITQEDWNFYF